MPNNTWTTLSTVGLAGPTSARITEKGALLIEQGGDVLALNPDAVKALRTLLQHLADPYTTDPKAEVKPAAFFKRGPHCTFCGGQHFDGETCPHERVK